MITLRNLLVAGVLLIGLSGCVSEPGTPVGPLPAPTSAAPESEPGPAAVVEITATGFRVLDTDGTMLEEVAMGDDPLPAVSVLTEAIGAEPSQGPEGCRDGAIVYSWGDVAVTHFAGEQAQPNASTLLSVTGPTVGPIAFRADDGFTVGDPIPTSFASLPADQVLATSPQATSYMWERVPGIDPPMGATAFTENGVATVLFPMSTTFGGLC